MKILAVSIDLNKIDKTKIIPGKKGGKWYNLTVFISDSVDQYDNDVSVCDSQSKEDRTAQKAKNYLGNGRVVYGKDEAPKPEPQDYQRTNDVPDSLPF